MNKKIQILRAFAIIAVVMIHTNASKSIAPVIYRPFLNFCVALFIFVSGYLTKAEITDIKAFYKRRIIKVLIPYIIWTVIYTAFSRNFKLIFINLLTADASAQLYYILCYIQLVLLTPIIGRLLKSKYSWIGWVISPVSIIIMRYICNFAGVSLPSPLITATFFVWFIFYYLGMSLGNGYLKYKLSYKASVLIYVITLVISVLEGFVWYRGGNFDMATTQLRLTSTLTSVMALLIAYKYLTDESIDVKSTWYNKLLLTLGNCSSGIFFSHMAVKYVISVIFGSSYLFFPITSLIVLSVSCLCVMAGKKILGKYSKYLGL